MSFQAVLLSCGHTVVLVPWDTPDSKLPSDECIWTKSTPVNGQLVCPDDARLYRVIDG